MYMLGRHGYLHTPLVHDKFPSKVLHSHLQCIDNQGSFYQAAKSQKLKKISYVLVILRMLA